jgi:hypothetical protein
MVDLLAALPFRTAFRGTTLLPADQLLDLRQHDVMAWRREREDYEPPESEEEDDEGMASDAELDDIEAAEGGSVSMAELAAG